MSRRIHHGTWNWCGHSPSSLMLLSKKGNTSKSENQGSKPSSSGSMAQGNSVNLSNVQLPHTNLTAYSENWTKYHKKIACNGCLKVVFIVKHFKSFQLTRFHFLGLQNHCGQYCSHEIKRCLLLRRKAITNLNSILQSRDITLLTKVCIVKATFFSVIRYRCES